MRLIAPKCVRPLVKRQKNDATDAEAIVVAARQLEMRFVSPKSEEQQTRAAIFLSRERLVRQPIELLNALRGLLNEYGLVFPIGMAQVKRLEAHITSSHMGLPHLVIWERQDLPRQIAKQTACIEVKTKLLVTIAANSATARRLQTMPGVGPMTAHSLR